jgi:hypothetical protein
MGGDQVPADGGQLEEQGVVEVAAGQLLGRHADRDVRRQCSAVLLGDPHPRQAEVGQLGEPLGLRERLAAVPAGVLGSQPPLGVAAQLGGEVLLLLCEPEFHGVIGSSETTGFWSERSYIMVGLRAPPRGERSVRRTGARPVKLNVC